MRPGYTLMSEKDYEGVTFPKEVAADLLGVTLVKERTGDVYWTPTRDVIRQMEGRLNAYVQAELPEVAPHLSSYKRQYFGFERQNNRFILIVGFCEPLNIDWRRELVALPDAPGCYLEAQYDVANDVLLYAWTNYEQ